MEVKNPARPASLPKLLLCDDQRVLLDALTPLLSEDFNVLAVNDSRQCLQAVDTFGPHLVVLEVEIPGEDDGFTIAAKLRRKRPNLPIVFLSTHSGAGYINRALQVGAKAYISKTEPATELLSALRTVANGRSLLKSSKPVSSSATKRMSATGEINDSARELLTPRQCETLRLIARGYTAKDIANELKISVSTAEFHRQKIMERLNLHSTAELTRFALTNDLG